MIPLRDEDSSGTSLPGDEDSWGVLGGDTSFFSWCLSIKIGDIFSDFYGVMLSAQGFEGFVRDFFGQVLSTQFEQVFEEVYFELWVGL